MGRFGRCGREFDPEGRVVGWVFDREVPRVVALQFAFLPHARQHARVRRGALVAGVVLRFFEVDVGPREAFFVRPFVFDVPAVLPADAPDVVHFWVGADGHGGCGGFVGGQVRVGGDLEEGVGEVSTVGAYPLVFGFGLRLLSAAGGSVELLVAGDVVDLVVATLREGCCYFPAHLGGRTCSKLGK